MNDEDLEDVVKWLNCEISPDGTKLLCGDFKGHLKQWKINQSSGELELEYEYGKVIAGNIRCTFITSDSNYCFISNKFGMVKKN